MEKIRFVATKKIELSKALRKALPLLSNYQIEKLFKDKDVKLNGIRKTKSCIIKPGDEIEAFYQPNTRPWHEVVYEDDNILIVDKRAGIEVVSEDDRNLLDILKISYDTLYAVHRIDRNTQGLVVFAKNIQAEKELLEAFKKRTIIKKYLLKVRGKVNIDAIKSRMFLKKFSESSKVLISEIKTSGYEEIVTKFSLIKYLNNESVLQAELVTGKTHQIRAHIAYFGYPIVGDGKYGIGGDVMCLTAYYMGFNFDKKSLLEYLNSQSFEIIPTWWQEIEE